MRERTRRRVVAEAKSHRATPEELREAPKRVKELETELFDLTLTDEVKRGESREHRYARLLRLRALREDFASERPPVRGDHPNGFLLSIVMAVASFLLCAACAGGVYFGLLLLNQKPNPADTAAAYWTAVQGQNYGQIYSSYLSPTQRVAFNQADFVATASNADDYWGSVTSATLVGQPTITGQRATFTYQVVRPKAKYSCQLVLVLLGGSWSVDDLGSSIDPTVAGLPAPKATPSATPSSTPADSSATSTPSQ
jgi:hypothetical protein